MANTVRTTITNKRRTPYTVNTGRNRKISIRGGETVTLPYDLFSFLSRTDKNEYTLATQRGILDISTEVVTPENTIVISQEGSINIHSGTEEPEKTTKHVDMISSSFVPPKDEKRTEFNTSGSGTIIADKSKALAATGGVRTESANEPRIKDVVIKNGKLEPANTVNVMGGGHNNLPKADTVNVFTVDKPIEIEKEDGEKTEKIPEEAVENGVTPPEQEMVEGWLSKKDFNMLYAWLTDNYPEQFAATTKVAIRKCKTYKDLKTLLNI